MITYFLNFRLGLISKEELKNHTIKGIMLIKLFLKKTAPKKMLFSVNSTDLKTVLKTVEDYMNKSSNYDLYKDDIEYIAFKLNDIKYYKVNVFIKNLTKKIELLPLKERPKDIDVSNIHW